jgi:hypothetical protein
MSDWEYDAFMSEPEEGLLVQMRITYKMKNGRLVKETITRRYMNGEDYQDSVSTEVFDAVH